MQPARIVSTQIIWTVVQLALLLLSIIIHEVSHGYAAYRLGDPTAKEAGRLSLNPLDHLDPFGSVVLPLLLLLAHAPVFGYAKPVPYNPYRLKDPKRDEVLVALAGPASNFLQALVAAVLFRIILTTATVESQVLSVVLIVLYMYASINVSLMLFNLIPLPPLDGSALLSIFIPKNKMYLYYKAQSYAMPILLVLFFLVPAVFHVDPLGNGLSTLVRTVTDFLLGVDFF